eukprot:3545194-Amphidinium_carterae.3
MSGFDIMSQLLQMIVSPSARTLVDRLGCVRWAQTPAVLSETARLVAQLKQSFKSKDSKQMLVFGHIVGCFERPVFCEAHSEEELPIWKHVGHMSLSPYRPTLHMLKRVMPPDVGQDAFLARVVLEALVDSA